MGLICETDKPHHAPSMMKHELLQQHIWWMLDIIVQIWVSVFLWPSTFCLAAVACCESVGVNRLIVSQSPGRSGHVIIYMYLVVWYGEKQCTDICIIFTAQLVTLWCNHWLPSLQPQYIIQFSSLCNDMDIRISHTKHDDHGMKDNQWETLLLCAQYHLHDFVLFTSE